MDMDTLLDFMALVEKLKCSTRHSWTSDGRRESVAEHSFRLCVFAWLVKDQIPDVDADRLIRLCLFHDLGEAVTGDIPAFEKDDEDRRTEREAWDMITKRLPVPYSTELSGILQELEENQTKEAQLAHALDKMEALIQHNEASIDTWLPLEYELQRVYGNEECEAFAFTRELRGRIRQDSEEKILRESR